MKNISKTSLGDSGIASAGPTAEMNGFTSTGVSVLVHVAGGDGESDVELPVDRTGEGGDGGPGVLGDNRRGDLGRGR